MTAATARRERGLDGEADFTGAFVLAVVGVLEQIISMHRYLQSNLDLLRLWSTASSAHTGSLLLFRRHGVYGSMCRV